jgi:hypothetical protein
MSVWGTIPEPMKTRTSLFLLGALCALLFTACATPNTAADRDVYLFSFFREPNGQAGLQLATSTNGLNWTEIQAPNGKSFLEPKVGGRLMRDPSLALGPDGTFHMVWTTSWGRPPVFGYASSKDLVHWTEQRAIPVMEDDPECKNVWAPELFYDAKRAEWIVFWATTVPGKFSETEHSGDNNHRIYCVTTKDFQTFSKTRLFYDGSFNVIDAAILPAKGKFYLVVKDETKNPVRKHLRLAVSDAAAGPYGPAGKPFTVDWVEGPSPLTVNGHYYVYFDHYSNPKYYGAMKSADLETWQDISSQVSFPRGIRHGTALKVPASVVSNLQNLQTKETIK